MNWNLDTGEYRFPSLKSDFQYDEIFDQAWDYSEQRVSDLAESWLSRPGGEYFLGISFHYPSLHGANGIGTYLGKFHYSPSPFLLSTNQEDFGNWHVNACLCGSRSKRGLQEGWEWQPGVLILDRSMRYTLPGIELSAISGSEIAEDDYRLYYGFYDYNRYHQLTSDFLSAINNLTGPGWPEWPFGRKQLSNAALVWTKSENALPDLLLLAQSPQHGRKRAYLRSLLSDKSPSLIGETPSTKWKLSKSVRLLNQTKLLLHDGFVESSVLTAVLSMRLAVSEVLGYLDRSLHVEKLHGFNQSTLLELFTEVLPRHQVIMPESLLESLRTLSSLEGNLYNNNILPRSELNYETIESIEDILVWLRQGIGKNQEIGRD